MKNIITGLFRHETNSFHPQLADEAQYRARHYLLGQEVADFFRGTETEMGAVVNVLEQHKDEYRNIPTVGFDALPCGPVSEGVLLKVRDELLKAIRSVDKVDGILLCIHGAAVSEITDDCEGYLLEIIRKEVGPDVPIITTLDLHTNMTKKMMANATAFFPYHHYPHIDYVPRGTQAAQCMIDTLEGKIKPVMSYRKLPMLLPYTPTKFGAMAPIEQMCRKMEEENKDVINISICHGFFTADMSEEGPSVVVVTDNNPELGEKLAKEIAQRIWDDRKILERKMDNIDEAIDEVEAAGDGPYCFADVCDNPGAGGTNDTTHILRRFMERNVQNAAICGLTDPAVVAQAIAAGPGSTIHVQLGGHLKPEINGEPIVTDAYVRMTTDGQFTYHGNMKGGMHGDFGRTCVLLIGGVEVVVTEKRLQSYDLECFRMHGIHPEEKAILVVKSTLHYRANYTDFAKKLYDIDVPGMAPQDPRQLKDMYTLCQRPIYPLDSNIEFEVE